MRQFPYPQFPWIAVDQTPNGVVMTDTRTTEWALIRNDQQAQVFIARHSAAQGYRGLGDAVRGVTQKLGIGECTPCAKRQAALNRMVPRFGRRR